MSVQQDWADYHELSRQAADHMGEWAGLPVPLPDYDLVMEDRYPVPRAFWANATRSSETFRPREFRCGSEDMFIVRNHWRSRWRNLEVYVIEELDGRIRAIKGPAHKPGERITFWVDTFAASRAWDPAAEITAQGKLATMIKPHLMDAYRMTGTFVETSKRSRVTYVLRRNRPTVAMVPRTHGDEDCSMRVLAVLCLHPSGYYHRTWAGAMVPTDDVIAHLAWIRGDERGFWAKANQHDPDSPEAGL